MNRIGAPSFFYLVRSADRIGARNSLAAAGVAAMEINVLQLGQVSQGWRAGVAVAGGGGERGW